MTAQELADAIRSAQIDEYGTTDDGTVRFGFPSEFFDLHVTVTEPDGSVIQRSPRYCATVYGAQCLQSALEDAGKDSGSLTEDWARPQGGGFVDSKKVPFLDFGPAAVPDSHVNVALMLEHFTHGYPGPLALQAAIEEEL